jgi:Tfp pilus assembly protein PilZ
LTDLSVGGAFIVTDFSAEVDRLVQISFTLPNGSKIECHGKISWLNLSRAGSPLGFGINFVMPPGSTMDAIIDFLKTGE